MDHKIREKFHRFCLFQESLHGEKSVIIDVPSQDGIAAWLKEHTVRPQGNSWQQLRQAKFQYIMTGTGYYDYDNVGNDRYRFFDRDLAFLFRLTFGGRIVR